MRIKAKSPETPLHRMILSGKYDQALQVRLDELYGYFGLEKKESTQRIGLKDKPS